MSKKQVGNKREMQENYERILNTFPSLPPYTMKPFNYPLLSAKYEMFKDKKSLHLLQQQSWLASFYMEQSKTDIEAITKVANAKASEELTTA